MLLTKLFVLLSSEWLTTACSGSVRCREGPAPRVQKYGWFGVCGSFGLRFNPEHYHFSFRLGLEG